MTAKQRKYNGGNWTPARYRTFITSALRSSFRRWPPRSECLKQAAVGKRLNPDSGRVATFYVCKSCNESFSAKHIQVDHVKPIVPTTGWNGWDEVINRLYCELAGLQVLCKPCHKIKTQKENKKRLKEKKNGKEKV